MEFIFLHETELQNLLQLIKWGGEGAKGERQWGHVQYNIQESLIGIVRMKPLPYHKNILIKIYLKKDLSDFSYLFRGHICM
jgi:hypothetical protein